jgi:hypothetical protein
MKIAGASRGVNMSDELETSGQSPVRQGVKVHVRKLQVNVAELCPMSAHANGFAQGAL